MKKIALVTVLVFAWGISGIAEEAKKTEKKISAPVNLLRNADFSMGVKEIWKCNFKPEESVGAEEGTKALKVPDNIKNFKIVQYIKKPDKVKTYLLKFKAKGPQGQTTFMSHDMDYKKNGIAKRDYRHSKKFYMDGKWRECSHQFTPVKYPGVLLVMLRGSKGGIEFCDISLTEVDTDTVK